MKYQDRNFLKLQERQKQNPKESKKDFLIRTAREKKSRSFYKKIAHKIYKEDYWYSFTDKQIDEIINLHKTVMNNVGYLSLSTITFLTSNGMIFTNEESYLKHIKENFKPDPAIIRERQLKKLGI